MLEQIQGHQKERQLIRRNSQRLLGLINQMLDLSKLESNKLSLHLIKADIIPYLRYLMESFHSLAEVKEVALVFQTDIRKYVMDFDEEKIQQIIEEKIDDADLDIAYLCKKVHLSSTQLYRKMKDLTGEPPMSFIRKLRLHKAMEPCCKRPS